MNILENTTSTERPLRIATPEAALRDLKGSNRINLRPSVTPKSWEHSHPLLPCQQPRIQTSQSLVGVFVFHRHIHGFFLAN